MYSIRPAQERDNVLFYFVSRVAEPGFMLEPKEFIEEMKGRQGFAVLHDGEVVGSVMFSHLRPGKSVVIHCIVRSEHHGKWARPSMLRQIADYAYDTLGVEEIIGYGTDGINDKALLFLEHLGFEPLRTMRVLSLHRDRCRFR